MKLTNFNRQSAIDLRRYQTALHYIETKKVKKKNYDTNYYF